MLAMVMTAARAPLREMKSQVPEPSAQQILIRVGACGVCRTDLHILDGELPDPKLPLILGHQIAGTVQSAGSAVVRFKPGDRVGVPWLGWSCSECKYCRTGRENLCDRARFTGYQIDGGYAEFTVADARYAFPIPASYSDLAAAPLLCAGLIGYRALRMCGDATKLGFYGFGSAAHILVQIARRQNREVLAFTRPGDTAGQDFARSLGCVWAGGSNERAPEELEAAIIFAPAGELVPVALRGLAKGGTIVCAGIHMSDIPGFPYELLWGERSIRSVANLTRADGQEFFRLLGEFQVKAEVERFELQRANQALEALRSGHIRGTAVLTP